MVQSTGQGKGKGGAKKRHRMPLFRTDDSVFRIQSRPVVLVLDVSLYYSTPYRLFICSDRCRKKKGLLASVSCLQTLIGGRGAQA
jgi:hypothetical protein